MGSLELRWLLQSEINKDCAHRQDSDERHSKVPEATPPLCKIAAPRFVSKIFYLFLSEANALKFIWLKIGLVKLI